VSAERPSGEGGDGDAHAPERSVGAGRVRIALLLAPLLLPWTVYVVGSEVAFVFPWGLVDPSPLYVTDLYSYLFLYTAGLPDHLLAWPLSVGLYLVALAGAAAGRLTDAVDARIVPLALALAGFAHLSVAQGLAFQPGRAAYPVGTAALWAVALVLFWTGDGRTV
jgi:uncharacterized protein (TIGR04206 family)